VRRAADAGSRRVMATAEIGTRSAANLERFGIHRIWTRGHLRVDPADPADPVRAAGTVSA